MHVLLTRFSSPHMRPHYSALFLIASLLIPWASADGWVGQDSETQPDITSESDTRAQWAEFMSLLDPANITEKIQEASFISDPIGNHVPEKPDNVQRESRALPDSLYGRPDQSLEALLSEETRKIFQSLQTMANSILSLGMALYDVLEYASSDDSTHLSDIQLNPLLKNVAKLVVAARDDFLARFPLPATAPGHTTRVKSVSEALGRLQWLLIRFARNQGIEKGVLECYLDRVKPLLHDVGVLIGDMSELYPAAVEALVLHLSAVLLPEAVFLRSLVILYCLGPYVLGRDAISGWLLKRISEALRV